MRGMRWRAWAGAIAVGMSVIAAQPAQAAGPPRNAPAASLQEMEEIVRLQEEIGRLYGEGKYAQAIPLAERLLAFWEKEVGPEHPVVGNSLSILATLHRAQGDYGRAEPLYQRALAIMEKAYGPEHPDVAAALDNLAVLSDDKGDYERAEQLYQRALAMREKLLGPEHLDIATTLNNLAGLYQLKGAHGRAEPLYQRALAILEKVLGPEHPDVATALNNLGLLYKTEGDHGRAEPVYQRSLTILEKVLGPEHPQVAIALDNLALLYQDKGDLGRAEPLHQRALAILEKVLGPEHPDVATALNNLALLYQEKGEHGRAEPLFDRTLAIREKALGPEHPDVASALNNLAALHQAKGEHGRAEPLLQRALRIDEKALGPEHPGVAVDLNNLAVLSQDKGEHGRAEALFARALALWEKALGPDDLHVALALNNLADLYAGQGRKAEAVSALRRAADLRDRNATAVLAKGTEEQKRLYSATLTKETAAILSLHVQRAPADPAAARLALTTLLRRKGRVLDAMADSLTALRRTLAPKDQALLEQLAAVYTELANQVSREPGNAPLEQYRATLASLEQKRHALETALSEHSAAFVAQQRLVTLADVQAALPEGAALVEIAQYRPFSYGHRAARPAERWGAPRYVAYVLRRQGEPALADLGDAAAVDKAARDLRRALGDHDLTHDPRPAARALDALLMQPVRKLLGESRWVFVSPDGPLSLLPFGALVDEQGHYLVERYLFSYLTSGRDLLRFQGERALPREAPLLLANPAFEDTGTPGAANLPEATHRGVRSIDMIRKPLRPLPSTREEARVIAELVPEARVLLGAQATEGMVKAAHAPRLLHLATHGFFLPEQPLPEALLTGPGIAPTAAERAALAQRENPLLRSGIALAGFNRRQSGNDDGVLTALETAGLDLYGTQLVVLSACETGLGDVVTGEGVFGLRRALSMAGAETQVMSLWQVDTGRTREMMIAYYQRLQAGGGRSEAMREVQLGMLADPHTAHPNLWASFVVSGDWRTLEGQARLPDVGRVGPGLRGCACGQAGAEGSAHGAWLALALAAASVGRRRASARCPRRAP